MFVGRPAPNAPPTARCWPATGSNNWRCAASRSTTSVRCWHLDFHHGSRKVLTRAGQWVTPLLLGVIDDRSRLVCHLQWYLDETAESLVHGLSQAFMKRGLPRALMTDNGAAMLAEETVSGLAAAGHRAPDDAAVLALSECQAGIVLGPHRGAPDGHARRRGDAHPRSAQRGHPGLGRAGIPPHASIPRSTPRRSRAISPAPTWSRVPRLRGAARRLPHRGSAPAAPLRRHRQPGRRPLRDPRTLSPPQPTSICATRAGT